MNCGNDAVRDAAARPAVAVDDSGSFVPGVAPGGVSSRPQISMPSDDRHLTGLQLAEREVAQLGIRVRELRRALRLEIHHEDVAHRPALDAAVGEPLAVGG